MIEFKNVTELERALKDAQNAHHEHEQRMRLWHDCPDWSDPEWALWYATHMDIKYRRT